MQPDLQNRSVIASEIRIVEAWHEALNAGDVDRLVALLHPDVARWVVVLAGPATAQLLREWLDRANIRLDPRRVFHQADTVVVEQEENMSSADTGQVTGSQAVTSVFVVRDDQILRVVRYPNLADALRAVNLDESYETRSD